MGILKAKCPRCWDPIPCGCKDQDQVQVSGSWTSKPEKRQTYADVKWTVDDVLSLPGAKGMTRMQAYEFLVENERRIRDRLCVLGFEVIETLLAERKSHAEVG